MTEKLKESLNHFGGPDAYRLLLLLQEIQSEPLSTFYEAISYLYELDNEYQKSMISLEVCSQEITPDGKKRTIYALPPLAPAKIDIPFTRKSKNSTLYEDISKLEIGDSLEFSEMKPETRSRMITTRAWLSRHLKERTFHIRQMGEMVYRIWRTK